jgi:hypothetical protein
MTARTDPREIVFDMEGDLRDALVLAQTLRLIGDAIDDDHVGAPERHVAIDLVDKLGRLIERWEAAMKANRAAAAFDQARAAPCDSAHDRAKNANVGAPLRVHHSLSQWRL